MFLFCPSSFLTAEVPDPRYAFSQPSLEQVFLEFAHVGEDGEQALGSDPVESGVDDLVRDPTVTAPTLATQMGGAAVFHEQEQESLA